MLRTMAALTVALCVLSLAPVLAGDAPEASAITHSFLATGGKTFIMMFDKDNPQGKMVWQYPAATREGWVLPNGNLLLAVSKGAAYKGGAAIEITRDNKVVWEYKGTQDELSSVQKTPEGTYVVTECGKNPRLLELDAEGKTLADVPMDCQKNNSHMEIRMARKLADGTYLVPHLLDFAVKQYDKTGKVLKVIDTTLEGDKAHKTETWPFTAIRLANGNTLCGLTHSNRVAEFDPEGKKVWELTNEETGGLIKDACGVQRLPNGNTIVNSYAAGANQVKLFEVTPEKKIVWSFKSAEGAGIHHFHVIDTNGVPLEGVPLR